VRRGLSAPIVGHLLDESTLRGAEALAGSRGKGYQTLLKVIVSERLYEEEKREGIVRREACRAADEWS